MKIRERRRGPDLPVPETTLPRVLLRRAAGDAGRSAFLVRPTPESDFDRVPLDAFVRRVRSIAGGLVALGVRPGDRVAVLSRTRLEWLAADYGILFAGAATVTIYPTLTPEQVLHVLEDSGAVAVFVEDEDQYRKVAAVAARAPSLRHVVAFDAVTPAGGLEKRTLALADLEQSGEGRDAAVEARVEGTEPDDLATIIYTSGTTGVPKGARLTHRNWVAAAASFNDRVRLDLIPEVRTVCFLPLAHVASLILTRVLVDVVGSIAFGSPATLARDLKEVRPTALLAVPRLWQRIQNQVHAAVAEAPPRRQALFRRAEACAMEWARARSNGAVPLALGIRHAFWDKLVYAKVRRGAGLDAIRIAGTGAAAIRPEVVLWFNGFGVKLVEGYGLTEITGTSNINPPGAWKAGTVGPPLATFEQAIAEDGEVLMRGPCVFEGYHNLPAENAQAFVEIDGERWFASGDVGAFDADGHLRIVDRKKEIEVLDTGKKIAPVVVEEKLKASPYVAEALLVATDRKYAACLLQPNFEALLAWAERSGVPVDASRVRRAVDPTGQTVAVAVGRDLLDDSRVVALLQGEVDRVNATLADFERVKAFRLVDRAWTAASEELTPTLKKRRKVIREQWSDLVEDMFRA